MPRETPYQVPTHILADQAEKMALLYNEDTAEHKEELANVGLTATLFDQLLALATEITEVEAQQEHLKDERFAEKEEDKAALAALLDWRSRQVIRRARIAFDGDVRLHRFRPGKLRSHAVATVLREVNLLIPIIERFAADPGAQAIGLGQSVADQGKMLWAALKKEDFETIAVASDQYEATVKVNDLEGELSSALANIEQRAVIAFAPGTPVLRRYRMKVIRDYVAMAHRAGDESAAIAVVDPDPSAQERGQTAQERDG